jgi:hypothetical protein
MCITRQAVVGNCTHCLGNGHALSSFSRSTCPGCKAIGARGDLNIHISAVPCLPGHESVKQELSDGQAVERQENDLMRLVLEAW